MNKLPTGIDARTGRAHAFKNLTGLQFERLKVIKFAEKNKFNQAVWLCRCICGAITRVVSGRLKSGESKSCGCLQKELVRKTGKANATHGHTRGYKKSPEFNTWVSMIQRCTDPKVDRWKNYGGAGVRVCDRWLHSFENFLADMGPRPKGASLGRTLDLGNYEPGNVFWMTKAEQTLAAMNKRHLLHWAEERDAEAATLELRAA